MSKTATTMPSIAAIQAHVLPMMQKGPTLVAKMAESATKHFGLDIPQVKIRSAIDRARRGAKGENPIQIDRVAPNTFAVVKGAEKKVAPKRTRAAAKKAEPAEKKPEAPADAIPATA